MSGAVLTFGNFDGVHLGHQSLFKRVLRRASTENLRSVALTFDPHPVAFFSRENKHLLTSPSARVALIKALGVDRVEVLQFDAALARLSYRAFFSKLKEEFSMQSLIVGPNTRVGKGQEGTPAMLREVCKENNIGFEVLEPFTVDETVLSSSLIRRLIVGGQIKKANAFLGRLYEVGGLVCSGKGRGGQLGFSTANVAIPSEKLMPRYGVYAGYLHVKSHRYKAVCNYGYAPSVDGGTSAPVLEVHAIDQELDILGAHCRFSFVARLRGEQEFADLEALTKQIAFDCKASLLILK